MTSIAQTLAEQIASGPLPLADAIRTGILIADRLRQLHEQGVAHGALTPASVAVAAQRVELLPADGAPAVTPYTAPEILHGNSADARSDIFSFGAILYELLTGRRAFAGGTPEELAAALESASPRPSGVPAVDRLMNACLAKAPEDRFQHVRRLLLELKMLASAARRSAGAPATPRPVAAPAPAPTATPLVLTASINMQVEALENRIGARLAEQERAIAGVAHVANEVLQALRQHQAVPAPPPPPPARTFSLEASGGHGMTAVERALDLLGDRVARLDLVVGTVVERLQKLEANLDAFDTDAAELRDSVTRDVRNFERMLKAQHTAIESTRTAMGQTDDLVERVVEALDSMQSMFVTPAA
jgi:hypothetical protein